MDFDHPKDSQSQNSNYKVIFGSDKGLVVLVSLLSRQIDQIYQLHDSSINALQTGPGYCITGSDDLYLRVWPLDFSKSHLELKNDREIIHIDICYDGVKVLQSTKEGFIGCLQLDTQICRVILRAHRETVVQIDLDNKGDQLISLSQDSTMRIWDQKSLQETIEFSFPMKDECTCVLSISEEEILGGFVSGIVRVLSLKTLQVEEEIFFNKNKIE